MKFNILLLCLVQLPLFALVGKGAEFEIRNSGFNADGHFFARFLSDTNFYYVLRRGSLVTQLINPRDLALPGAEELELVDSAPDPDGAFYRVEAISQSSPDDVDHDGIDDLFELHHPEYLNPIDPLDALLDLDGDGVNNLTTYRRLFGYPEAQPLHISRELSLFNFGQSIHRLEAFSQEVSIYQGSVISPSDLTIIVSREVSGFNFGSPPLGATSAISREVSTFNFGSPVHSVEAFSREVSVYQGAVVSPSDTASLVSREVSVFNFGQAPHSIETISREVSVLNFSEPQ